MINTQELKNAVSQLYTIIPHRTTMPILQTILMQNNSSRVKMTASDLAQSLTLYLNTDLQISHCVPAKQLKGTIDLIRSPDIDIDTHENKIVIKKNPGQATIRTMTSNEFPIIDIPNKESSITIDAETLASALKKALISVSDDSSHQVLNGILVKSKENVLEICSADGFRVTIIQLLFGLPDFEIIIPSSSAKSIISVLEQQGKVFLVFRENQIVMWNDNFIYTSQLIAGSFPELKRIIPITWNTKIKVDKATLTNAINQALVYAVDSSSLISLEITQDEIIVSGKSNESGRTSTPVKLVSFEGQPVLINANGTFVKDGLSLSKEHVELRFNGPTNPIGIFIPNNDLVKHIMMPMHLGKQ